MTGEPSDGRTRKDERSWKEGNTGGNHISCLWPHLKRFLVLTVSDLKYSCFSGSCVPLLLPLPLPHLLACLRYRILLLRNLDNLYDLDDLMTWRPDDLGDSGDLEGFREFQYGIIFCLAKKMSSHFSSKKLTLPLRKFEEFKTGNRQKQTQESIWKVVKGMNLDVDIRIEIPQWKRNV